MKCHMLLGKTVVLFFVFFVSCCVVCRSAALVSERLTLLELKASVSDPTGILSSWNSTSSDHHCSWFGVSCDSKSRVVSLGITGSGGKRGESQALSCSKSLKVEFPLNGFGVKRSGSRTDGKLSGKLSPLIGKLTELRVLSLPYNDLSGVVPLEIWGLQKLEVLDLEGNLLTGKLPSLFTGLRRLRILNLGSNRIDGEIPFSLSKCGGLEVLNLAGNAVNGTVPGFFGSFRKLQGLYLSQNRLTGDVSAKFGSSCWNLEHLDLSGNFLVGRIPDSLGNCRRLQRLLLFSNMFSGGIPHEFGHLRMLEVLDVSRNNLSGPVPAELGQCINLSVLVLSNLFDPLPTNQNSYGDSSIELSSGSYGDYNSFGGSIPLEITTLPNLRIVWAPKVTLEGKLPSNWGACENLEMVNLAQNQFRGEVYGVFERCKKLNYLDLSSNKLTGKLDEKLSVPCMTVFNVSGNLMSGSIPRCNDKLCFYVPFNSDVIQIDNPSVPYKLFFTCRTSLETPFPFIGASSAVIHDFSNNNFSGPIKRLPIAQKRLAKKTNYAFLSGGNKLTGPLSEGLFGKCDGLNGMILNVSNNRFSGRIPLKIGFLCRSLTLLDVSGNEIYGPLPSSLGDLTSLVVLDLSRNKLQGHIPESMSHLKYLKYLSLADNNLTGTIINRFVHLDSLEVLDLSSNSLSGDIPQRFVYLRNLTILRLDNNEHCRRIPSRLANVSFINLSRLLSLNNSLKNCSGVLQNPLLYQGHIVSRLLSSSDQPVSNLTSQNTAAPSSGSVGNDEKDGGLNSIEIASVVSASAILLALLVVIGLFLLTRKCIPDSRVRGSELREITVFTNINVPLTFEIIVRATGNFNASNCIGNGGFGATYKAEISSGVKVAVKRLAVGRFQGVQQFHAEIKTLRRIRHPNLVTLVGYHASENEMFLVYNYLPGGNLENFIKERHKRAVDWKILHKIALDIANALAYLHDQCVPRVLHRDVKPSNILLDNDFNAYLSDFGLSRLLGTSETHATTGVAGTFGYVAPEYAMTCRVSEKSDVYSYGVVLLELISDKKALDPSFSSHGDGFNIVSWAWMLLRMGRAKEFFTDGLWDAGPHDDLVEMLYVAVTCTVETLSIRPTMRQVVQRLKMIRPS
ncbi:hypothetical protein FNV43_RR26322 [Rhamnella rubrinervis]|uniref:non-specific serine/threonine protein kinase n=1 Tax=Rhamnella rubrinervis TaxID=2594499 RepID=A0A8K0GNN4_9ROSA|nr:hypothetical protein FNV43_RR26322 [Rhamnella rubrinervis]